MHLSQLPAGRKVGGFFTPRCGVQRASDLPPCRGVSTCGAEAAVTALTRHRAARRGQDFTRSLAAVPRLYSPALWAPSYCEQAILRGTDDAEALSLAALVQVCLGHELARSTELAERSIALNSNSPFSWYAIGLAKLAAGNAAEAVTAIGRGIRLNPRDPAGYAYLGSYALALFVLKNYQDAVKHAVRALAVRPTWAPALRIKAASLAKLDMTEDARMALLHARKIDPHGSSSLMARMIQLPPSDLENCIGALRVAGLDGVERHFWRVNPCEPRLDGEICNLSQSLSGPRWHRYAENKGGISTLAVTVSEIMRWAFRADIAQRVQYVPNFSHRLVR
ncbi:hypothetical protein GA0061098_1009188 [Bradyrhizobium shewense]|uniref:Uncharacterized protein n=1 Tax=Bradyrhizobium shewense TaxID=1761772 RepID=A0A1C3WRZ8_9BRAD|nr:hypothetical protein GA0061098_1009188 [Bradyrhizobium shewense]